MNETTDVVVVFITTSSRDEANKIARILVEQRKAACVNIVSNIESIYWWRGKMETALEAMLIVKTISSKLPEIVDTVKKNHTYQVPEIIAIPITGGNKDYIKWIQDEIKPPLSL